MSADEKPRTCKECKCQWLITEEGSVCPNCGWAPAPAPKAVHVVDAQLVETKEVKEDWKAIELFYREACQWYAHRWPDRWEAKPNSGRYWAWSQTRTKFKRPDDERMPSPFWGLLPQAPGLETAGWLKAQQIRWAKRRQNEPRAPM